jgi:hypothetical protein
MVPGRMTLAVMPASLFSSATVRINEPIAALIRCRRRLWARDPLFCQHLTIQCVSIFSSIKRLSVSLEPVSSNEFVMAALPFSTLVIT